MKNVLFMENDEVTLLTNVDDGTNRLVIEGHEIPYSYWVGTGTYTYKGITINKTSSESLTSNLVLKEVGEKEYFFTTKKQHGGLSFDDVYPVGSIYMTVSPVDPATLFGGTWEIFSQGRVLVGVDTSQVEFNTVEKEGGAKDFVYTPTGSVKGHALTVNEMPAHIHDTATDSPYLEAVTHINNGNVGIPAQGYAGGGGHWLYWDSTGRCQIITKSKGGNAAHSHDFVGVTTIASKLQPYITCYIWKRTA